MDQYRDFIQNTPPFNLLTSENINEILTDSISKNYSKNATIINQGNKDCKYIFVVVDGIAINTLLNDAKEQIVVKTYSSGDVFGITHAMSGAGFMYSIRAVSEVNCLLIPIETFERMMLHQIAFTEEVVRLISHRLREVYKQLGSETSIQLQENHITPYRKKVIELMAHPLILANSNDEIVKALDLILDNRVSSIIVTDEASHPVGIITKKDLLKAFHGYLKENDGQEQKRLKAREIMASPLITIDPQAFYYEALHIMVKYNIKHLPVIDDNKVIGMVTPRNFISSFSDSTLYLVNEIENESTIDGLARVIKKVDAVLKKMLKEHATSKEISSMITELNDRITKKIIYISEQEMISEGYGAPPIAYSWISLGSEGRKEQTLHTDQDNAIIYADIPIEQQQEVDSYFNRLAEKVVQGLIKCGFPKCVGDVMATNKQWRNTANDWKRVTRRWINDEDMESIRLYTIFIDFRPIYGDKGLAEELRKYVMKESKKSESLFHLMAKDDLSEDVAIDQLGNIITNQEENGMLDIKKGGLLHIVNGLRILALKYGISEVNSWERLDRLYQLDVISLDDKDQIIEALDDLMMLRIQTNLEKLEQGLKPDHFVDIKHITKKDKVKLKKALMTTRWFQLMVGFQSTNHETYGGFR